MRPASGFNPRSPEMRERLIDDALRAGQITLRSAPEWRRRLEEAPEAAERALLALAAVPEVGRANVEAMAAG